MPQVAQTPLLLLERQEQVGESLTLVLMQQDLVDTVLG